MAAKKKSPIDTVKLKREIKSAKESAEDFEVRARKYKPNTIGRINNESDSRYYKRESQGKSDLLKRARSGEIPAKKSR